MILLILLKLYMFFEEGRGQRAEGSIGGGFRPTTNCRPPIRGGGLYPVGQDRAESRELSIPPINGPSASCLKYECLARRAGQYANFNFISCETFSWISHYFLCKISPPSFNWSNRSRTQANTGRDVQSLWLAMPFP